MNNPRSVEENFEEAIKQKNDHFSKINVAWINYFGIDIEPKISEAFKILLNLKDGKSTTAQLFSIYTFDYGPESIKNESLSLQYDICFFIKLTKIYISSEDNVADTYNVLNQKLRKIFKEYEKIRIFYAIFFDFIITRSFQQKK